MDLLSSFLISVAHACCLLTTLSPPSTSSHFQRCLHVPRTCTCSAHLTKHAPDVTCVLPPVGTCLPNKQLATSLPPTDLLHTQPRYLITSIQWILTSPDRTFQRQPSSLPLVRERMITARPLSSAVSVSPGGKTVG